MLMVGLPGAGKTTRAQELAGARAAAADPRNEWMIALFDGSQPDGKRELQEGRLIALALQRCNWHQGRTDFGLWSRDDARHCVGWPHRRGLRAKWSICPSTRTSTRPDRPPPGNAQHTTFR